MQCRPTGTGMNLPIQDSGLRPSTTSSLITRFEGHFSFKLAQQQKATLHCPASNVHRNLNRILPTGVCRVRRMLANFFGLFGKITKLPNICELQFLGFVPTLPSPCNVANFGRSMSITSAGQSQLVVNTSNLSVHLDLQ